MVFDYIDIVDLEQVPGLNPTKRDKLMDLIKDYDRSTPVHRPLPERRETKRD